MAEASIKTKERIKKLTYSLYERRRNNTLSIMEGVLTCQKIKFELRRKDMLTAATAIGSA